MTSLQRQINDMLSAKGHRREFAKLLHNKACVYSKVALVEFDILYRIEQATNNEDASKLYHESLSV
jgi:hypothetical protein